MLGFCVVCGWPGGSRACRGVWRRNQSTWSRGHPDVVVSDRDPAQPEALLSGGARWGGGPRRLRLRKVGLPAVLAAAVLAAVVAHVAGSSGTVAAPSASPSPV